MMIVDGQESAKDVILCSVRTPEERVIFHSLDTHTLECIAIKVFCLLFNALGESTVVRASTFLDKISNYVKFHYEAKRRVFFSRFC